MNITHSKRAVINGITLSLDFIAGRISLYRFHGEEYESVGFGGTMDDYASFDDASPEKWFDIAFGMIEGRIGL